MSLPQSRQPDQTTFKEEGKAAPPRANPHPKAITPAARPLADSLREPGLLSTLLERVRASEARLHALHDVVPVALQACLRPGPLDDDGWTLLASNAAVAAKLRHLLPVIEQTLVDQGWTPVPVRVKVVLVEQRA